MPLKLSGIQVVVLCAYLMMVIKEMHRANLPCVYICTLKITQSHTFCFTIRRADTSIGGLFVRGDTIRLAVSASARFMKYFYRVVDL